MAVATGDPTLGNENPTYKKGLAHMQAGQWSEAVACFEMAVSQSEGADRDLYQNALEEARFKARIDDQVKVKPRRTTRRWQKLAVELMIVAGIVSLGVVGIRAINRAFSPIIANARWESQRTHLLTDGAAFVKNEDMDKAEAAYRSVLVHTPDDPDALAGLQSVEQQRDLLNLYQSGVAFQAANDYPAALQAYTEFLVRSPQKRDVSVRITAIKHQQEMDSLFADAEADYEAVRYLPAVEKYEQLQAVSASYQRDMVATRLFELYMLLGTGLIDQRPAVPADVPQALDYFDEALSLQPRNSDAAKHQRLAKLYLGGTSVLREQRWDEGIAQLQPLYDQQPNYLGGVLPPILYEAYVRSGDLHRQAEDLYFAYDQYQKAAGLPVADTALARGRMSEVVPLLTPTATATATPTITPIPTSTPYPTPTRVGPTPTPKPLLAYRGKIVFFSENPDQTGFYAMDPDGTHRQYIGYASDQRTQFDKVVRQYQQSPDGRYRTYVTEGNDDDTPQVYIQGEVNEWGTAPTWKVSMDFNRVAYDPMWSPDGSSIVFVSQQDGSDDIWVRSPYQETPQPAVNLTRNDWEWDKHPSWSPDSRRIVFWSNRTGAKQIFVMDADGRNVRNISNTKWDEYDVLWIR